MKYKIQFLQTIFILIAIGFVFNGCTALNEAQQRREERKRQKQRPDLIMLKRSDANIEIEPQALRGESDHYILTFAEDLRVHDEFDEIDERKIFVQSALGYMESLYDGMYDIFGFNPKHKIHMKLHHVYEGSTTHATTTPLGSYIYSDGEFLKSISGVEMDFPIAMYNSPGTRVHELTHAFTDIYLLPVWFAEGIAVLMEREYANDRSRTKFDNLERNLKLDQDGVNLLESWGGHVSGARATSLSHWRYSYAYTVVSELRKRYGDDFYIKVFELIEKDKLHQKLIGRMSTSFVVYYLSQAAGEDLVPFFENLQFDVHKLEKSDILQQIEQTRNLIRRKINVYKTK